MEYNKEIYSLFEKEVQIFSKNKQAYNVGEFLSSVFFPNIDEFANELPMYYHTIVQKEGINVFDVYDFCNSIIDDTYLKILKKCDCEIKKLSKDDPRIKEEEKIFETYCIYGLMLFNAVFLFNETILSNIDNLISVLDEEDNLSSTPSSITTNKSNKILKTSMSSVCISKQDEIVTNISKICEYLKELKLKEGSEYNDMLGDKLFISNDYTLILKEK